MVNDMRLGDLDAIEKFIEDGLNNPDKEKAFGHDAIEILAEVHYAPTIDAVEVVRCKDCKHFGGHGACHYHAADENGTPIFVRDDDFCSYGEKR